LSSLFLSIFLSIFLLLVQNGIGWAEEPPEVSPLPPAEGTALPATTPAEVPVISPVEGTVQPETPVEISPPVIIEEKIEPVEETKREVEAPPTLFQNFLAWMREEIIKDIELRGYIKNETAFRYIDPPAFTKILNILQLEPSYTFSPDVKLSGRIWAYYDLAYDIQDIGTIAPMKTYGFIETSAPGEPEPDIENLKDIKIDKYGINLKEFYLDIFFTDMDFRIGKQIIRWGIVEGWRILDEVNPLDFKEHILRDVSDRYIPLWMVKGDYYLGPLTLEGLWIPDVRGHEPAPLRSEWSQFQKLPDLEPVPRKLENSEAGLRVSGMTGGYEFAIAYLYHWDDFPAAFRSIAGLGLGNLGISPTVTFTPRYRRLQSYGLGLAKSLGKIVLEGEFAYVDGKFWGTCTDCTPEGGGFGELPRDYIKHVVGVKTVLYGADISMNFSQDIILDYTSDIQQKEHEDAASLFMRKEMRYGSMVPQLLAISLLNRHEYLFRPKLEYRYTDKITFLLGLDIFTGDPGPDPGRLNFFGYFDEDDRAYMEVKYSF